MRSIRGRATVAAIPSDLMLKTMKCVHRTMLKFSGGHIGWEAGKMPVLMLTTVGRKSGEPRTVMLTSPHQLGATYVIVASKGGEDSHPAWFLNLRDHPEVEVETKGEPKHKMVARIATAEERAELWPLVTAKYKNYAGYQTKTKREIPLVLLDPAT